jgi:hypothetical protein
MSFSPADILSITTQQITLPMENAQFVASIASVQAQQAMLLTKDNANANVYHQWVTACLQYEAERQAINGIVAPTTWTDSDVTSTAMNPIPGSYFFPNAWAYFAPATGDAGGLALINGLPTSGPSGSYEEAILPTINVAINTNPIYFVFNGITGANSASTTTTTVIPAGTVTNFALTVASITNFTLNDYLYINNGAASGLYRISIAPSGTTINITSVIPSLIGIATGATLDNTVAGFSNTVRTTMVSASYQEFLTNCFNQTNTNVSLWLTSTNAQKTALQANTDPLNNPLTVGSQNYVELNNGTYGILPTNTVITVWQTGANFGDNNTIPLSASISARISQTTRRISQINTSLGGSVSIGAPGSTAPNGNTPSGTGSYFQRWLWLNTRLNKTSGSLIRYYALNLAIATLQNMINQNTALLAQYNAYFTTNALISIDPNRPTIQIASTSGFSIGDQANILSNTLPSFAVGVVDILDQTQIVLDKKVPATYLITDLVRIYKELI